MADADVVMRMSESREVFGSFTPASGTVSLGSSISTLRDRTGAVISGVNGVASTGITSGASSAPKAWHRISPTDLSLSVGFYELSFKGSDGTNTWVAVVSIEVINDYD